MSRTLFRYVAKTYAVFFLGIFAGMVLIYLVVDFVDRAKWYSGPNWVHDVAVLYAYKALVVVQQLGPAGLLLGACVAVSSLRKRGELTAFGALTLGPTALYLPIGTLALIASLGLVAFDEAWVVGAGRRVDEISTQRFGRWGDWRFYFVPKQWFRHGEWIFYLRGGDAERGFETVTLLRVTPEFELLERIDGRRMEFVGEGRWRLEEVLDRRFDHGIPTSLVTFAQQEYFLDIGQHALRILTGRPEQFRLRELKEQIRARRAVGLPSSQFSLALHHRFAYPLTGVPAALLGVGLALRPGRKGHLTTAVVEGLGIALLFWGLMVIFRGLVIGERVLPGVAAWAPFLMLCALSGGIWLEREGLWKLGRSAP